MKRTRLLLLLVLLGCSKSSAAPEAKASPEPIPDPLVVHEWGTFTTLQGSNGAALEGLQHESEPLPAFVYSRTESQVSPFHAWGDDSRNVEVRSVLGKMETPVLYFYTRTPRRVQIHVGFTGGLMTQWFPKFSAASPEVSATGPADLQNLTSTFLEWSVDLVPFGREAPSGLPFVAEDQPWSFAREVKAAWVRIGDETERYIFYRGLGRPQLPLFLEAIGDNLVAVRSTEEIPVLFLLEMKGGQGRYLRVDRARSRAVVIGQVGLRPAAEVVKTLSVDMQAALVAEGLYEDEARAMVRTWAPTWFAAEGTRVLYIIPRQVTDAVLPMTITPAPDKLVRVMVGRHEYLTPSREAEIERAIRAKDLGALAGLGRFLEPSIRRIAATTSDPVVKANSVEILAKFDASP